MAEMNDLLSPEERRKVVEATTPFAPLLDKSNLTAEEIDEAIEELRPLRMHIRAIDYGEAPGFRPDQP